MLGQSGYKSEEKSDHDRRSSTRICCTGFAEGVSTDSRQLFRGEIRNVSETGCFISVRAAVKLAAGTTVELRFKLGLREYAALARVVEAMPTIGIRFHFIATDPEFPDRIRRILSANSSRL